MRTQLYDIGDVVRLEAAFTDRNGAAVEPDDVTFTVRAPDGTTTVLSGPDVTAEGGGVYSAQAPATMAGRWRWRAEGAGANQAAGERTFMVSKSPISG